MAFSLRSLLLITALLAVTCAVCAQYPVVVVQDRHCNIYIPSLPPYERPPTFAEATSRIVQVLIWGACIAALTLPALGRRSTRLSR